MPDTPRAQFKPTRWSLVLRARGQDEEARRALEELCHDYWFPLYAWCRRTGTGAADAEDHVQGFFVELLEKGLFSAANPDLGKLRTFLLTAFRRHVADEQRKAIALRRGGGRVLSFDAAEAETWYEAEEQPGESADHMFDRQWALTVLDQAIGRLERRARERGKTEDFAAMRPFLTREGNATDYEAASRERRTTPNAFKVAVHRLRGQFREALRAEIADTQTDGGPIEEEMAYLLSVLRGCSRAFGPCHHDGARSS